VFSAAGVELMSKSLKSSNKPMNQEARLFSCPPAWLDFSPTVSVEKAYLESTLDAVDANETVVTPSWS
jgi:hypothetical protein